MLSVLVANIKKIEKEINRLGWSKAELGRQSNLTKQMIQYIFNTGSIRQIHKIANALDIEAKDLVKVK
jgi:lambda repressor-like predicted transcriptional regulator